MCGWTLASRVLLPETTLAQRIFRVKTQIPHDPAPSTFLLSNEIIHRFLFLLSTGRRAVNNITADKKKKQKFIFSGEKKNKFTTTNLVFVIMVGAIISHERG